VGSDLVYILNEESQVSAFESADLQNIPEKGKSQAEAVSEINRVKIETSAPTVARDVKDPKPKDEFDFPEGGWVCGGCQNYNFFGRQKCNRCLKAKSKQDLNGKPKHLLRQSHQKQSVSNKKVDVSDKVTKSSLKNSTKEKENKATPLDG